MFISENGIIKVQTYAIGGSITIFNLLGQVVLKKELEQGKVNQIALDGIKGCFIVKVNSGSHTASEKVIIR